MSLNHLVGMCQAKCNMIWIVLNIKDRVIYNYNKQIYIVYIYTYIYVYIYYYYYYHYYYIYAYISSSLYHAASTDIPDPLSQLLPIVHRLWQVFRAISRILK